MRKALTREQVKMAVERTGCEGIPVMMAKWWGDGLNDKYRNKLLEIEKKYPDDVCMLWYDVPGYDTSTNSNPEYRFGYRNDYENSVRHSIGKSVVLLPDWDELDHFLDHFPNPNEPGTFDVVTMEADLQKDQYKIGCWWRVFHEYFWTVRGMENLMMDYYDNMDGLKKIGQKLIDYYKVIIDRYQEIGCDAIFTSDDLGHQHGPMMSPSIFHELYYPLYKELADYIHSKGLKFFLHSCGDNSLLLDYLVDAGLDVFHPVQKGCMDSEETASKFGDKISFLVGMDVQNTLVTGTPQDVRNEIIHIKKTFNKKNGGLLLAMGNGIMPDSPIENIEAALDEMYNGGIPQ